MRVPQEGHTNGSCARSAEMSANASGARYSFTPRLPTAAPLEVLIYYYPDLDALLPRGAGWGRGRSGARTVTGELLSQPDITVYRSDTPLRNS